MNFERALQILAQHEVEFVLVGGAAVVAHGSTLMTQDLDILYRVDPANVRRLLAAFDELDAYVYGDPRRLRFAFEHLANRGHHLTETKYGRVDALGAVGKNGDVSYEDVIVDAIEIQVFGVSLRCVSLERLLTLKRELGRPRDRAAVLELEAIQALRARSE